MKLAQRLNNLSPVKQKLLAEKLISLESSESTNQVAANTKRLVAYVVADDLLPPTSVELQNLLGGELPDYMLPQEFIFLDEIPLSPNGKVNIDALPELDQVRVGTQSGFTVASNPIEEKLVSIWSDVLGVDLISTDDNFFEIGGDSILSIQVIARARDQGIAITPRQIFQCLTIAELARTANTEKEVAIHRRDTVTPAPLSFAQQRLWFLDLMDSHNAVYNIPMAYRLSGQLNRDALTRSLSEIVRRHEVLRTTFAEGDDEPLQIVHAITELEIPRVDFSQQDDCEIALHQFLAAQASISFDLEHGPLLRAHLIKLGEQENVLSLVVHHSVFDGWSVDLLLRELSLLYNAFSCGEKSPLPELPIQYSDFSQWQHNTLQGDELERQLIFWKEHLDGELPLLAMPFDYPRPKFVSYRGATVIAQLPKALGTGLAAIGRQREATSFMVFFAAYVTLLYRYTGEFDLIVGTPIASRNHSELQDLIGLFVNTLAIRTRLTETPTFNELVDEVRKNCLAAYSHQDLPFEQLVEGLQLSRDQSRTPVFQTLFSFSEATEPEPLGKIKSERIKSGADVSRTDLSFHIEEGSEFLEVAVEYSTDLFSKATIMRLVEHFKLLLEGIIVNAEALVSSISLISREENQLIQKWNATERDYPLEQCMHNLFEAQVELTPDVIAIEYDGQSLTYNELEKRANQLARYLKDKGTETEQLVGVFMERSLEMVIGLYGILKSGCAYVPLDPDYPNERIAFLLEDTGLSMLVTQAHLAEKLPRHHAEIVCIDQDWDTIAKQSSARLSIPAGGDNLAYVIYTSGSTGKPKGVMNNHRGVVNLLLWTQETFQLTANDRILQTTPFSFDASIWEFFWPLTTGATLVMAKPGRHMDTAYLATTMVESKITTVQFVPSMLQLFLEHEHDLEGWNVRQVFCGGEKLGREVQDKFFETFAVTELYNLYGPTEAAVDVTHWACERDCNLSVVPIGKPHANTQCYILNELLHPVPLGATGELHIGGAQVSRGYLNRDDLTARCFVPDPFSDRPGARLYKTGDMVRYREDGNLEYIGRSDLQVKVRGLRIEPGEIESALLQHAAVGQCTITVREDNPGDQRLVAYVVLNSNEGLTITEMREHLRQQLPDYMVPQHLVEMAALPLTSNGKIDSKKLPSPIVASVADSLFVEPKSPGERYLAKHWSNLLGVEQISTTDNFFDMGGHSLLAAKMVTRTKRETGCDISLHAVVQSSLSSLAGQYFPEGWDAAANEINPCGDDAGNEQPKKNRLFGFFARIRKRTN